MDGPTRNFSGAITLNNSYGDLNAPFQVNGSAVIGFSYDVTSVNFGLNFNGSAAPRDSNPLDREVDLFVSRGYKSDGVADHADAAFWEGRASFDAFATMGEYPAISSIWPDRKYKWTVGPSVYLPDFPVPTEADKERLLPDASVTHKDFAWDFGDAASAGGFPRTSTVSVEVKDPKGNAPPFGPANDRTIGAGDAQDWGRFEAALGTALPENYKTLIQTYASGGFQEFFYVFNPCG